MHPWLKENLEGILANLSPKERQASPEAERVLWEAWQENMGERFTLSESPVPLRLLLILDNLTGHKSHSLILWFYEHGIMPLFTPLGGSWLNMAESIQRILKRRGLAGESPESPADIMHWLEDVAEGWNKDPTPFVWGGKRAERRRRARERRRWHPVGGSGAYTLRPIKRAVGC
ncbi:MAG: transposase [Oligoflexales bacterium]|nr:transposase [Oligoflexales bacterium]